ncbi:MAG: hypothetical protein Q9219_006931 [cf. Caloplaca sp. 3 TL-2023]
MKAGAAFVPLDAGHPRARLEHVLSTTKARLVVTSENLQHLYHDLGREVVVVSAHTAYIQPDAYADNIVLPTVGPRDPAFVLFTSGSTGQPKGMIHEHGPVTSHATVQGEMMGYYERVFQFSAFTFDMSVHDMFSTLIVGGCICIPSEEDRLNNISEVMNRMRVEYAFLTPSVVSLLRPDDILTLKALACGGECYRQEIINRWKGKIRLINSYGPAEAGTIVLRFLDGEDNTSRAETVGYPLPTILCVLVDPENHNRLVPIGAVGELLVVSTALTRGYIGDEAKNRASFLSNLAWAKEMGLEDQRFYKTGDLLRYNVGSLDGKLDWVRRKDSQVKFHGQRMEVGEVEHHLNGIHDVVSSAVVFPVNGCFSGQLVAVVQKSSSLPPRMRKTPLCIDSHQTLSIQTVKKHLSKTLPGYMIPTQSLVVGSMPFTPSCKVDRRAVQAWLENMTSRPDGTKSAETSIETSPLAEEELIARSISGAVAEIIGSRDKSHGMQLEGEDFLLQSCGIDSIQIISLSNFVQRTYGIRLPMRVLLSSTNTVRDLARIIDDKNRPCDESSDATSLLKEVEMHALDLSAAIKSPISKVRKVFLTGASGYLGSGILRDLLQRPEVEVFALVRAGSTADGLEHIKRRARSNGWWQECYTKRVHIWKGDLTQPDIGLSDEHLQQLRGERLPCIDTVIHNGAKVHYNLDYETLKAFNVHPTKQLLTIVSTASNLTKFVYISGGRHPSAVDIPESMQAIQASQTNGYGQSKFVAERLVEKCMNNPVFDAKRLHIIRPGYIIGSPRNGVANQSDFIWRLIAGCIEIGAYDEDEERQWLFLSDVERVAEVATDSLFEPHTKDRCGTAQVLDGLHFSDLWTILRKDFGYFLKPLGRARWLHELETTIQAEGESHKLFPLLHTLETMAGKISAKHIPAMSTESYNRVMDAVRANVRHLIEVGFLEPPKQVTERPVTANSSSDSSMISWEERSLITNSSTDNVVSPATSNEEDDPDCKGPKT